MICKDPECNMESYHFVSGVEADYCVTHHMKAWKERKILNQLYRNTCCTKHNVWWHAKLMELEIIMEC